jgi:tetratricopeptide (TPR) repeat protein
MTVDDRGSPALQTLGARDPDLVHVVTLDLDMPSVFEEISAELGLLDESRDVRSSGFVRISHALRKGDLPEAEAIAAQAVEAAEERDAPQEAAIIHFTLGSALLAKGRAPDAILRYGQADAAASRAERQGESSSSKLRVITRLALGSALIYAGAFEKAAEVYQTAAPLAASQGDLFMQVESWRMAGYAHERAGAHSMAWAAGMEALRVGAEMSPKERATSTLAYAGEGLLRVAQRGAGNTKVIHERMTELLGPSWRAETRGTRQGS